MFGSDAEVCASARDITEVIPADVVVMRMTMLGFFCAKAGAVAIVATASDVSNPNRPV